MQQDDRAGTNGGRADRPRGFNDVNAAYSAAMVVLLFAYGWWAVSLPPFSGLATMAVIVPGGAALVLRSSRRSPQRHGGRVRGVGRWGILVATAVCWQVAAYLQHPRADHPTVSSLTNTVLDTRLMRCAAFGLWLLAMIRLARR